MPTPRPAWLRAALVCAATMGAPASGATEGLWATGYYPAYATRRMPISSIPFASLTHVVHFALVPRRDGTLSDPDGLRGQTTALVEAAHAAGVKALLGVGGDEGSGAPAGFQRSATSVYRSRLVTSMVEAMAAGRYDGIDVNWESLRFPADVANFRALVTDLRKALDRRSPAARYLLTYPAGTASSFGDYKKNADMLRPVQARIDQINLQTYVMAGPFPGWVTWHNSALYAGACRFATTGDPPPTVDSTVKAFQRSGISKRRIGIGVQLAGVDWSGGSGTDAGGVTKPCQAWDYSGTKPDGSGQDVGAPRYDGGWSFVDAADVIRSYTAANGYVASLDGAAMVPYLSRDQPGSDGDHFVSYETAQSIQAKGDYVKAQGLGGVIVFEITQDYLAEQPAGDAQHPLMTAVRQHILQ